MPSQILKSSGLFSFPHYLDSEGNDTGKNMRFVDMCIEIDNTYKYNLKRDPDRIAEMLYAIIYMVASKGHYFISLKDYDIFSTEFAAEMYDRLEHPVHPDVPIKSCLNYIKGVIGFRKISFLDRMYYHDVSKSEAEVEAVNNYMHKCAENFVDSVKSIARESMVNDLIDEIPNVIYNQCIPEDYAGITKYNIWVSVMLSLINKNITCWNLSDDYKNVIQVTLNKLHIYMKDEIGDIIYTYTPTQKEIEDTQRTAWEKDGEHDELSQ